MPIFVAALLGGLVEIAASLVGRVLIVLSISFVTYTGLSSTLDYIKGVVVTKMSGLGPGIVGMLSTMKIDVGLSIIFSAYLARLVLQGLSAGGSITKMVTK